MRGNKSEDPLLFKMARKKTPARSIYNCCGLVSGVFCRPFEEMLFTTELCPELRILWARGKEVKSNHWFQFWITEGYWFFIKFPVLSLKQVQKGESNSLIRAEGRAHLLAFCHVPLFLVLNVYWSQFIFIIASCHERSLPVTISWNILFSWW